MRKLKKICQFLEFPCLSGSLPDPPEDGVIRRVHQGFKFGHCVGIYSTQPESLPECPEIQVLITDDETVEEYRTVYTKTIFEFSVSSGKLHVYLRLSKEIYVEDITVRT